MVKKGKKTRYQLEKPAAVPSPSLAGAPTVGASSESASSSVNDPTAALREIFKTPFAEWPHQSLLDNGIPPMITAVLEAVVRLPREQSGPAIDELKRFLDESDLIFRWRLLSVDYLNTPEGRLLFTLDPFRWGLARLLRWSVPTRMGEGVDHCEKLLKLGIVGHQMDQLAHQGANVPHLMLTHAEFDPKLYLYYGVALAISGTNDAEAKEVILSGLRYDRGETNGPWAKSFLARILRRLGETEAADTAEKELVRYFKNRPMQYSPKALREMLLLSGEDSTPLMDKMNKADVFTKSAAPTAEELRRRNDHCLNCSVSGIGVKLLKCGKCKISTYCSAECQLAHWKASHKAECGHRTQIATQEERDLALWGQTMVPTLENVVPSAIAHDLSKIQTHCLVVKLKSHPDLVEFERFEVLSAELMPTSLAVSRNLIYQSTVDGLKAEVARSKLSRSTAPTIGSSRKTVYMLVNFSVDGSGPLLYVPVVLADIRVDEDWFGALKARIPELIYRN